MKKDGISQKTGKVKDVLTFLGITYSIKDDTFIKDGQPMKRAELMLRFQSTKKVGQLIVDDTIDKMIQYLLDGSEFVYNDDAE